MKTIKIWNDNASEKQISEIAAMLEDGQTIDLYSEVTQTLKPSDDILYTLDESLPAGTRKAGRQKRTGYVVDTCKVYYDAEGNELRREKLWTTTYRAQQEEILYH